jgi:biofilm PGA synthesis lipoprotein PgaB
MRALLRRARAIAPALGVLACAHGAFGQPARPTERPFPQIAILCYHDVSTDSTAALQTVPPAFLREQIRACKADGWTFLSLSELLAQREHPERLPARVLVLTFDDGYRSFADAALPILRAEGVRPTLAVITSFVEQPHPDMPPLLTWAQLRALDSGGDVELASHSHALHQYVTSNPFGDTAPSTGTRRYLPAARRYENRDEFRSRIGDDLAESQRTLRGRLGHGATTLVWPYGMHGEMARGLAKGAGFAVTLALSGRAVTAADLRSGCLPRIMVTRRMEFRAGSRAWLAPPAPPLRAAQVDLDAVWDPDEAVFRARLDQVVTRVKALGVGAVILPVCPGPNGEGRLLRAYAMNHQLPVLADVWSMAAAKFAAAGLRVWVRAPVMNLTWAWLQHPEWRIRGDARHAKTRWGTRLSPDLPGVRTAAADFMADLAVYLPIDGVLFDDDAMMLPGERLALDAGASAAAKSAAIRGLVEACRQSVTAWRPDCRFARCLSADVLNHAGVDAGHAQALGDGLAHDELIVIAPGGEGNPGERVTVRSVERLARRAVAAARSAGEAGPPPVMLLLPTYDARAHRWIEPSTQQEFAAAALRAGLTHLGTGPVAAEGPLPVGLLEDGAHRPVDPRASQGY